MLDLSSFQHEHAMLCDHRVRPRFARNGVSWVEFGDAAREFAAAQQRLPAEIGTSDGLPAGWLSEFAACAAFVGASEGDEPRRVPSWLSAELKVIVGTRSDLPDGRAVRVAFARDSFLIFAAFDGRIHLWVWRVVDAIKSAKQTLARTVDAPADVKIATGNSSGYVHHYSHRPERITYPYAMPTEIESKARRLAHYIATDEDIAVWLAGQTLLDRLLPGYDTSYCPRVLPCEWMEMPVELRKEMIDGPTVGLCDFWLAKYGTETRPIGRVDGDRYYFWIHGDDGALPHYLVIDGDVRDRVVRWKRNTPAIIPAGVVVRTYDDSLDPAMD